MNLQSDTANSEQYQTVIEPSESSQSQIVENGGAPPCLRQEAKNYVKSVKPAHAKGIVALI